MTKSGKNLKIAAEITTVDYVEEGKFAAVRDGNSILLDIKLYCE